MTYRLVTLDITLIILESLIFEIGNIFRLALATASGTKNLALVIFPSSNTGDDKDKEPPIIPPKQAPIIPTK